MKFLANENFPRPSVTYLRSLGYIVSHIAEDASGISDPEVLEKAVKNEQVILTFDSDYGELIFKHGLQSPPAVVYFRVKGTSPDYVAKLLVHQILEKDIELTGYFTVVDSNGT
ncbi:MAG: DUF5615 family PIN-like protein [Bacteroidota bacterium]